VQSNFFSKDRLIYGANGRYHFTGVNSFTTFQTLCIERQPEFIRLKVDGREVRYISRAELGDAFPNRPSKVVFDIWDGGLRVRFVRELG